MYILYIFILLSLIVHNILLSVLATSVTPERMFLINGILKDDYVM